MKKSFILLLAVIALAAISCGRRGHLIVPGTVLPNAVADLKAEPRGASVILSWTGPAENTAGRPLTDLAGYSILRGEPAAGQEGCPCEMKKIAYVDLEYPKGAVVEGRRVVFADADPALAYGKRFAYKVAGVNKDDYSGELSNTAFARLLAPPKAPAGLAARPGKGMAALSWEAVGSDSAGMPVDDLAGYNVYRATDPKAAGASPVNPAPVTDTAYEDKGLANGTEYFFRVSALRGKEPPYTEGDPSAQVRATPSDKEPPARPAGLRAVPGAGAVLLSWDRNKEPDLKGYILYRQASDETGARRLNAELLTTITYRDTDVAAGKSYTYTVVAVDDAVPPNVSPASEPATVKVP